MILLSSPHTCLEAFTAFRNARDYAREQRDALILAATERASEPPLCKSFNHNPTGFLTNARRGHRRRPSPRFHSDFGGGY